MKLKYHPAAPTAEKGRRVDFHSNRDDQTVLACALLGWRVRDIAALTGMSSGQVTYRINTLLKIHVSEFRGENKLSISIMKSVRNSPVIEAAKQKTLRAADITPKFDTREKRVLA